MFVFPCRRVAFRSSIKLPVILLIVRVCSEVFLDSLAVIVALTSKVLERGVQIETLTFSVNAL